MLFLTILLALLQGTAPEGGLYWVFFADRGENVDSRLAQASARIAESPSAARRASAGVLEADVYDLDPWAPYVEQVEAVSHAPVRVGSRYLNAVSVRLTDAQVEYLLQQPYVREVRPVGVSTFQPVGEIPEPDSYGLSRSQLEQTETLQMHQRGWTGGGVIVGILDTGFDLGHPCLQPVSVLAQYDFINQDSVTAWQEGDPQAQPSHGTKVLSVMGGYDPGLYVGGAFDASFVLAKTEDTGDEYQQEEDFWVAGLEWLELQGADLVNSSLGYTDWYEPSDLDGNTAVTTIAADLAASRGLLVYNSAGNNGPEPSTLSAPADGDSVFAAGAVDGSGAIAAFSSRGPTADGRTKPDGCARGENAVTASWGGTGYSTANGTSFASPIIAATAACISSAHPEWSMMRIYDALRSTANRAGNPDNSYGYGLVSGMAAAMHRSVIGTARRSDTGDPLEGLTVAVSLQGGEPVTAVTNQQGCFAIEPGGLGTFTAAVSGWGASIPVQGVLGESGTDIDLYVDPLSSSLPPSVYPNPSSGEFYIGFDVVEGPADVSLTIFTVAGEEVFSEHRSQLPAGCYRAPVQGEAFHWNAENGQGDPVASGQYIALINIDGSTELLNIALIRGME